MRSALYYPHTEVENAGLLKTALLLWDQLEFIVPYPEYEFSYQDRLVAEAVELVGVKHSPSDEEKKQAHEYIEDFVTQLRRSRFITSNLRRARFTLNTKFGRKNCFLRRGGCFRTHNLRQTGR
jgi:hypothetical protein